MAATLTGVTRTTISGGTALRRPYCSAASSPMYRAAIRVRPVQQLGRIGRRGGRTRHRDERERRPFVVEAQCDPAVAQDRLALDRVGRGHEHDLIAVEVDPDGSDVRAAVDAGDRELGGAGRHGGHEALPPALRRFGVAHRARRYPRRHAHRVRTLRRELRDAPGAGPVDSHRPHRRDVLDGRTDSRAGHALASSGGA